MIESGRPELGSIAALREMVTVRDADLGRTAGCGVGSTVDCPNVYRVKSSDRGDDLPWHRTIAIRIVGGSKESRRGATSS